MSTTTQSVSLELAAAINFLQSRQWGIERSLDYLSAIRSRMVIFDLYQQCFPNDWAATTASSVSLGTSYSDREIEFFQRLEDHWFPIYVPEERLDYIEIQRFSCDLDEIEFDELSAVESLITGLYGNSDWHSVMQKLGSPTEIEPPIASQRVEWKRLEKVFSKAEAPLRYFPNCIRCVGRFTGNVFFDSSWEEPLDGFDWTIESLTLLREEWQKAKRLLEQEQELDDWLTEDPSRIGQIVALWNRATKMLAPRSAFERNRRLKVQIIQSQDLEAVLQQTRAEHHHDSLTRHH